MNASLLEDTTTEKTARCHLFLYAGLLYRKACLRSSGLSIRVFPHTRPDNKLKRSDCSRNFLVTRPVGCNTAAMTAHRLETRACLRRLKVLQAILTEGKQLFLHLLAHNNAHIYRNTFKEFLRQLRFFFLTQICGIVCEITNSNLSPVSCNCAPSQVTKEVLFASCIMQWVSAN